MKTVVIAAMGRSGSTMIAETIAKHPAIYGGGEVFNHDDTIRRDQHHALTGDGGAFAYYPGHYTRPDLYVDLLASMARFRGKSVLSFKLMESQCPQLVPMLAGRRAYIAHCYRRNFASAMASWRLASATGVWHTATEEARNRKLTKSVTATTVVVDPREIEDWGRRHDDFLDLLRSTGLPIFPFPYEDTRWQPSGAVRRLFDLIEVAPIELESAQVRVNRRKPSQFVENWAHLRKYFHGTKWEWMFEEENSKLIR